MGSEPHFSCFGAWPARDRLCFPLTHRQDGFDDVIVGAPNARNRDDGGNVPHAGVAKVFSGFNGAVIFTRRGTSPNIGTYETSDADRSGFYYRPDEGMQDIKPLVTVRRPREFAASEDLGLVDINNLGSIVGGMVDVARGFVLDRRDGDGVFLGDVNSRPAVTTANGMTVVAALNDAGVVIVFRDECECVADWNRDGVANSADVGEFINLYFAAQAGQPPFAGCTI